MSTLDTLLRTADVVKRSALAVQTLTDAARKSMDASGINGMNATLTDARRASVAVQTLTDAARKSMDASAIYGINATLAEARRSSLAVQTLTDAARKSMDVSAIYGINATLAEARRSSLAVQTLTDAARKSMDASAIYGINATLAEARQSSVAVQTLTDAARKSMDASAIYGISATLAEARRSSVAVQTLTDAARKSMDAAGFDGMRTAVDDMKQSTLAIEVLVRAAQVLPRHELTRPFEVERESPSAPPVKSEQPGNDSLAVAICDRYQLYRDGKEFVASMAYACLTMLQARAGGRKQAAQQYRISPRVLDRIGYLSSHVGDLRTGRKFTGGIIPIPHSREEIAWLEAVVEAFIVHLGTLGSAQSRGTRQLTMDELPRVAREFDDFSLN